MHEILVQATDGSFIVRAEEGRDEEIRLETGRIRARIILKEPDGGGEVYFNRASLIAFRDALTYAIRKMK